MDNKKLGRLAWEIFLLEEITMMLTILPTIFITRTILDRIFQQSADTTPPFSGTSYIFLFCICMFVGLLRAFYSRSKYRDGAYKFTLDRLTTGMIAGAMLCFTMFTTFVVYDFVTQEIMSGIQACVVAVIIWIGANIILAKEFESYNKKLNSAKEEMKRRAL